MTTNNHDTQIDHTSVVLAGLANELLQAANAAGTYHEQEVGGTYGTAKQAVITALACGLARTNKMYFGDARELATSIYATIIDNGDSVRYNLALHNIEVQNDNHS